MLFDDAIRIGDAGPLLTFLSELADAHHAQRSAGQRLIDQPLQNCRKIRVKSLRLPPAFFAAPFGLDAVRNHLFQVSCEKIKPVNPRGPVGRQIQRVAEIRC